jgi:hypothetical protein
MRRSDKGRVARGVLATAVLVTVPASSASAGSGGGPSHEAVVKVTVDVAVRSVTVTPNSITLCATTPLQVPFGSCQLNGAVTVTNGTAKSHIDVQGADAVPSDGGKHWALCGTLHEPCANSTHAPGVDQYTVRTLGTGEQYLASQTSVCDFAFKSACSGGGVPGGASQTETIILDGPQASTDPSPRFTTTITWTAVP